MKALTLLITTVMMATLAFAQAPEATLKSVMKEMSSTIKLVTAQAADPSKNATSAELTAKFVSLVKQAKSIFPNTANDKLSQEKYLQSLDVVIENATALQSAFASNDNIKASELLNKLVQNKKDGHEEFKN